MRIGMNIVPLFPGLVGGAEQYIRNTIAYLEKCPDIQLDLYANNQAIDTVQESGNTRKFMIDLEQPLDPQLIRYIDEHKPDVWFCPLFDLMPAHCSVPSAVSILDIQQEYFPENFTKQELVQRRQMLDKAFLFADRIITISEFSKKTMMEKFEVPAEKITVTYLDADGSFDDPVLPERKAEVRQKYGLPDAYFLYPANSWPHKNHDRLIQAFAQLKEEQGIQEKLVFTGSKKQSQKDVEKLLRQKRLKDDIIYLGYIDQEDMPYIFADAELLVFPSLFEGFGIPPLEAMRVGLPIAASNVSSLPEVCGEAALYFDPYDVQDIAKKLDTLRRDKALQAALVETGRARAKEFSWERCARETLDCLRQIHREAMPETADAGEKPLVSIITPSYNQGEFIRETIESVLSQDYPNIEYIVMDGGSTDETVDILKSYGDRFQWVSKKDGGQADAVNQGIRRARGKYIGWLNSDDTFLPGAVTTAVTYLQEHPQVDMVYGEGYYTDKESNITHRYPSEPFSLERLAENCYICQPAAFFRKRSAEKVGLLDPDLHLCMDYDLWIKMGFKGKIDHIDDYLATSRLYDENKTLSRREEVYQEIFKTVFKHYKYVPDEWIYGYFHFRYHGRKPIVFWPKLLLYMWRHNPYRRRYVVAFAVRTVRDKVKRVFKPQKA